MSPNAPVRRINGKLVRMRALTENPASPRCALHLRRVCGTCVHFGAEAVRACAACALLGGVRAGGLNATGCAHWARKTAGGA
jgi:hypothetical protein